MSDESAGVDGAAVMSLTATSTANLTPEPSVQGTEDQLLDTDGLVPQIKDKQADDESHNECAQLNCPAEHALEMQLPGDAITNPQLERERSSEDAVMGECSYSECAVGDVGDGGAFQQNEDGSSQAHNEQQTNEHGLAFVHQPPILKELTGYNSPSATEVEAQSWGMMQHDDETATTSALGSSLQAPENASQGNVNDGPNVEPEQVQNASIEIDGTEQAMRDFRFTSIPNRDEENTGLGIVGFEELQQEFRELHEPSRSADGDDDHEFDNFNAHTHQLRGTHSPGPSTFGATKTDGRRSQSSCQQWASEPVGRQSQQGHLPTSPSIPDFSQPCPDNFRIQQSDPSALESLEEPRDHAANAAPALKGLEKSSPGPQSLHANGDLDLCSTQPTLEKEMFRQVETEKYHRYMGRHNEQYVTPGLLVTRALRTAAVTAGFEPAVSRLPQATPASNGGMRAQGNHVIGQASDAGSSDVRVNAHTSSGYFQQPRQGFATSNAMGPPSSAPNRATVQHHPQGQQSPIQTPDLMVRGRPTSRASSVVASDAGKSVSGLSAGPQNNHDVGPPNYHFGPPMGPGGAPNYPLYGMGMYGQGPTPFNPQGFPNGQQHQGMYGFNSMNPYHPPGFMFNQNTMPMPMPMPSPNPQAFARPGLNHGMPSAPLTGLPQKSTTPAPMATKRPAPDSDDEEGSEQDDHVSSDDEPLMKRAQGHLSKNSHPGLIGTNRNQHSESAMDGGSEVERARVTLAGSSAKLRLKLVNKRHVGNDDPDEVEDRTEWKKAATPPRALPKLQPILVSSDGESDDGNINWKLPTYAVEPQPYNEETELHSVKISLPGMIREELIMTPDNATQEIHLLQNLFLPAQQALTAPDPEPTTATLNFHTIANMVLDAYAAYQAGDELTSFGRRKRGIEAYSDDEESGGDEKRDPRSADVDEIYFAVIDRWRTGKTSNKKSYSLIRGVQEFSDIALDVIYFIHENGLVPEHHPQRERKERSDKGTKRGPRGQKAGEGPGAKQRGRAEGGNDSTPENSKAKSKTARAGGSSKTGKGKTNILQPKKKKKTSPSIMVIELDEA